MNLLNIQYPNNSNISIIINSGENYVNNYFGGTSGQITGNQIYNDGLEVGQGQKTNRLTIESSAASYTGSVILSQLNAFPGATLKYLMSFPASINPVIQFIDSVTSGILITQTGEMGAFKSFVEFEFDGNQWQTNFWC